MRTNMIVWSVWILLLATIFFAPGPSDKDLSLVLDATLFRMNSVDPILIAMFNLMGVWPLAYGSVMIPYGKGKRPTPYPFFIASFFTGAFALLPYMALLKNGGGTTLKLKPIEKALAGRTLSIILGLFGIALTAFGVIFGDPNEFLDLWSGSMFVSVMAADFLVLTLMFPIMVRLDSGMRGCDGKGIVMLSYIPLIGPMIYLIVRPPLKE